ncbi:multisubunit sodium/proton antiporter MrpD subunit [Novosphingobium sp. PhB165]|uniref:complex I subunit 5 family protein n=1 Tax=Novosphingobium sp. PhB165 TaxID=2485105 RepID=UPI00104F4239|nr:proton-conducting transporter membrane subunit [Novosphingobium sp. PhB165]TCM16019.1 multisubunit sodium/proton antiporter MrpD subunit [Novosphingobium sp. PhB165]
MTETPAGLLIVLAVLLPFVGMMLALMAGGRNTPRVAAITIVCVVVTVAAIGLQVAHAPLVYQLGGWAPPLGVALRADGPAAGMMAVVTVVVAAIALYARRDFAVPEGLVEARAPLAFWLLLLAVWGSLNLIFVSGDLFTLYVGLELLTFAGVPLVCLDGRAETLRAALRYLLFALMGSLLYLLGTVLIFGVYGTLDIELLSRVIQPSLVTRTVLALMTAGLLAKTALFPLHIWLPPAHAGAPAAASAILSGLVIKGSWFLIVRLWFDVMPGVVTFGTAQLLGAMGAAAIVVGSIVALRQQRLKLLVAYSTVAQIGYLFLMFPLAFDASAGAMSGGNVLTAGLLQAASHATAKASMFMAAGLFYKALGHDRIAELGGAARALPITTLTFAMAGLALMGVVPSGAYLAKKLLLAAAADQGQWWWTVVLQGGAAFTAGYTVLVLRRLLASPMAPEREIARVSRLSECTALALALASLLLGFVAAVPGIGLPSGLISNPLAPSELLTICLVTGGGCLLAWGFAQRPSSVRPAKAAFVGVLVEDFDGLLRQWPAASLSLFAFAAAMGWLLQSGTAA